MARMDPVALPGGVQDIGHSGQGLRARPRPRAARGAGRAGETAQDRSGPQPRSIGPERLGLGGANREAEGLASTVGVDGDGNYHRDRDEPAGLAHLHIGSVAATRNEADYWATVAELIADPDADPNCAERRRPFGL